MNYGLEEDLIYRVHSSSLFHQTLFGEYGERIPGMGDQLRNLRFRRMLRCRLKDGTYIHELVIDWATRASCISSRKYVRDSASSGEISPLCWVAWMHWFSLVNSCAEFCCVNLMFFPPLCGWLLV